MPVRMGRRRRAHRRIAHVTPTGISLEEDDTASREPTQDTKYPMSVWLRALDHETFLTLTEEEDPFEDKTKGREILSFPITFIPELGKSTISIPVEPNIPYDSVILTLAPDIQQALLVHTSVARVASLDPSSLGLSPYKVLGNWRYEADLSCYMSGAWNADTTFSAKSNYLTHPAWRDTEYGWFASGADPKEWGTPFIAPALNEEEDYSEDEQGMPTQCWGLFTVGMEKPIQLVKWDRREAILALVTQVKGSTTDDILVTRVLMGKADDMDEAQFEYEMRADKEEVSRTWKDSYGLRPILVRDAIRKAQESTIMRNEYSWRAPRNTYWTVSYEVTTREGKITRNAGRRIVFGEGTVESRIKSFGKHIQKQLDARSLGIVFLLDSVNEDMEHERSLIIVRNSDYFLAHLPAYGVQVNNTTVTPLKK